jgi:hypothetical protein
MQSRAQLTVTPNTNELAGLAERDIDDHPRGATTDMGADHASSPDRLAGDRCRYVSQI